MAERYLSPTEGTNLVVKILVTYSVPLGVIAGGYFGNSAAGAKSGGGPAFWFAASLCAIWNLLVFGGFALFAASVTGMKTVAIGDQSPLSDLNSYIDQVMKVGSFLIGGSLAFYFAADKKASLDTPVEAGPVSEGDAK